MPPFRLQTLGSLSLHDPSGASIPGQGSQRRRLALLAVLAAAGDRGRSRDSLLTLLWPDASPERARHSLEQLVYGLRTSVNNDVFLGVNPVSLNPEVIRSDVREFGRALAEDRVEDAVAEYHGPFLAGFVLPDAVEFDQWADVERARLAGMYARALETLAAAAERRSDWQGAIEWWEKRAAHDPYDSRVAQSLMRALDAGGNTARAIQHAAIHERLLRRELGVQAASEVSALAERMRTEPRAATSSIASDLDTTVPLASGAALPRAEATGDAPRRRMRRVSLGLVAAVVVVVVAWLAWALWPAPARERSIAVLPFLDMSPRGDNEYFSDGITEEIITQLSAVPTLKVISRTSAMHYRRSTKSLKQIAGELGVANVLEGSVRRDGDTIRITAQLIDAGADRHLWARSYDRSAVNVIGVQEEIAREVSRALEVELVPKGVAARRGTHDPQAYEFYRRGRYLWNKRTKAAHEQAIAYYQRAIQRDPGYADAYAGLADAYLTAYQFNISAIPEAEVYSRIKWAAERAVALDAQSADAHTSFAVALWWQRDWPGAEREIRRALELNPGYATARSWYALLLSGMGRLDEAVQQSRRASELDPFAVVVLDNAAWIRFLTHDPHGAIELYGKSLEVNDAWAPGYAALGVVYAHEGMDDAAMRAASKAVELGGRQISALQADLAYVHARAGRKAEAERLLERAKTDPWEGLNIARGYVALGEPDSAFAWLDRSSWKWPHRAVLADPTLDPLRSDPRFARLSARVGHEMGIR